jgi:Uma2 family endonuclease
MSSGDPMKTTRDVWTYAEYARLPDDGDRYEVIDGEVLVTPAPGTFHQHVAANLFVEVRGYVERHGLGTVLGMSTCCSWRGSRYREFGVLEYWVADASERIVHRSAFARGATAAERVERTLRWQPEPSLDALEIDMRKAFATF